MFLLYQDLWLRAFLWRPICWHNYNPKGFVLYQTLSVQLYPLMKFCQPSCYIPWRIVLVLPGLVTHNFSVEAKPVCCWVGSLMWKLNGWRSRIIPRIFVYLQGFCIKPNCLVVVEHKFGLLWRRSWGVGFCYLLVCGAGFCWHGVKVGVRILLRTRCLARLMLGGLNHEYLLASHIHSLIGECFLGPHCELKPPTEQTWANRHRSLCFVTFSNRV